MAIIDNGIRLGTVLAVGIGAALLAPSILPIVGAVVKPLAKGAIKGGMLLYDRSTELVAETREVLEDLIAEAKAEIQAEVVEMQPVAGPESADA